MQRFWNYRCSIGVMILLGVASLALAGHWVGAQSSVELALVPSTVTLPGAPGSFDLDVEIRAGTQLVDGVQACIRFDPAYLQVSNAVYDTSTFDVPIVNPIQVDNDQGTVSLASGTFSGGKTGTFRVAIISFNAIANTSLTQVVFENVSGCQTIVSYQGEALPTLMSGSDVTIGPTPTPTPTPTSGITPTFTPTSTPTPTSTATPTATPTPISTADTGQIGGWVFIDLDGDGNRNPYAGETEGVFGVLITLLDAGRVAVATRETTMTGWYQFDNVPVGAYTVQEQQPAGYVSTSPDEVAVDVRAGRLHIVSFGEQPVTPTPPAVRRYLPLFFVW